MQLTRLFLDELDREAARTRRVLEYVPLGKDDWKPHERSMPLGRLAGLVAVMPSWVSLVIDQDTLDLSPPGGGGQFQSPAIDTLIGVHDAHVAKGRASLTKTTDEHLLTTNWKLLFGGQVVMEQPRHVVLQDTINHWSHHRGQLTVYLRMTGQMVPSVYGPSADDQRFL